MLKSRKKAILRFFSAFLILIVLLGAFYYLTLALSIRNTLMGFCRAAVSGDVSGVLHYVDLESVPKIMLPLAVIGLVPDAKEKSKKYLTRLIEYLFDVDLEEDDSSDFFRSLEIRRAFLWPGWKRCFVNAELRYSSQSITNTKKVRVKLINRDGEWLIAGITIK